MDIAVYFQTWTTTLPWTDIPQLTDIANVLPPISKINLAFVKPDTTYKLGQFTFDNTGLEFSIPFNTTRDAITLAKQKGIDVILSVGGASYSFENYNVSGVKNLIQDLGASGVDIDWEPLQGVYEAAKLGKILNDFIDTDMGPVSLTGWSTGAFLPDGSLYQGMDIQGLEEAGSRLDSVNIMAYDAGPLYDPMNALVAYRKYFKGPINLGFEVGQQAWGGAVLSPIDVERWSKFTFEENPRNGVFIWSYQKQADFNSQQVIVEIASIIANLNSSSTINPTVTPDPDLTPTPTPTPFVPLDPHQFIPAKPTLGVASKPTIVSQPIANAVKESFTSLVLILLLILFQ